MNLKRGIFDDAAVSVIALSTMAVISREAQVRLGGHAALIAVVLITECTERLIGLLSSRRHVKSGYVQPTTHYRDSRAAATLA